MKTRREHQISNDTQAMVNIFSQVGRKLINKLSEILRLGIRFSVQIDTQIVVKRTEITWYQVPQVHLELTSGIVEVE